MKKIIIMVLLIFGILICSSAYLVLGGPIYCINPSGDLGEQINCSITNNFGSCQGTKTCAYGGYYYWSDCVPSDPNFINYYMNEAEAEGIDIYSYYTGLLSCEDGIDNDCDGFTDSEDDGCSLTQNCVRISGVDYCCSANSDGICPENYENAFNEIISCNTFGISDPDCTPIVQPACNSVGGWYHKERNALGLHGACPTGNLIECVRDGGLTFGIYDQYCDSNNHIQNITMSTQ